MKQPTFCQRKQTLELLKRSLLAVVVMVLPVQLFAAESHVLYDKLGVDVIASDASQTVSYIKEGTSSDQFCAGTGSDFAAYSSKGLSLAGKDSIGFSDNHGVAGFGGRTELVLIAREMMFRACELSLNTNSNREQSIEIYKMFLTAVSQMASKSELVGTSASSSSVDATSVTTKASQGDASDASDDSDDSDDSDNFNDDT